MLLPPQGFGPEAKNPRRHPRTPRVYTYKEFQKCKKVRTVSKFVVYGKNLDLNKLGAHGGLG